MNRLVLLFLIPLSTLQNNQEKVKEVDHMSTTNIREDYRVNNPPQTSAQVD